MVFLETHVYILDYDKRYLNLTELFEDSPGWKQFGTWVDKGDYIECYSGWMSMFGCTYSNELSTYNLFYRTFDGSIAQFTPCDDRPKTVTDAIIRGACSIQ